MASPIPVSADPVHTAKNHFSGKKGGRGLQNIKRTYHPNIRLPRHNNPLRRRRQKEILTPRKPIVIPSRPPNNRPHPRQRGIRQRRHLHPSFLPPFLSLLLPTPQLAPVARAAPHIPGAGAFLVVRRFLLDEQAPITRDGHDDDGHGGLELQPKDHPGGIDRAVGELGAGDADNGHDDREDGQAEDEHEEDFPAEGDADAPEESDGDDDDLGYLRSAIECQSKKAKQDSLRISVKMSKTAAACMRLFCRAKAAGVEHLTARRSAAGWKQISTICS